MQDGISLAKSLLGKLMVYNTPMGRISGMVVETEAYMGPEDKAAHSSRSKSQRTLVQYGPGGFVYMYRIYGIYHCFNVVANIENTPHCVLIRGLEPAEGVEAMMSNRGTTELKALCSGPGKLCVALGLNKQCYGVDLCGDSLFFEEYLQPQAIMSSPRINVDYAEEYTALPWRFYIKDNPHVSKHKNNRLGATIQLA